MAEPVGQFQVSDDASHYRAALEAIEGHFLPGDERRTYADATTTLDMIRREVREALVPPGCPCVGTPDQEDCPHE